MKWMTPTTTYKALDHSATRYRDALIAMRVTTR